MRKIIFSIIIFTFSSSSFSAVTNIDLGVIEQGQRVSVFSPALFTIDWPRHYYNCGKPILWSPNNVSVAPAINSISYEVVPMKAFPEAVMVSGRVGADFNSFIYGYKNYLVLNGTNGGDSAYVRGVGLNSFVSNSKWELQLRTCGFNSLAANLGYPGAIAKITINEWVVDARNLSSGTYNDTITLKSQLSAEQRFTVRYRVVKQKNPTCSLILPRQSDDKVNSVDIDLGSIPKGFSKQMEESFSLKCKEIAKVNVSYLMEGPLLDNGTAAPTVDGGILKILDSESGKALKLDNSPYQYLGTDGNLNLVKKFIIINDASKAKSGGSFRKKMNINYRYE